MGVLDVLKSSGKEPDTLREVIRHCLHADEPAQPRATRQKK